MIYVSFWQPPASRVRRSDLFQRWKSSPRSFRPCTKASDLSDVVIVSIFVNPMQFGPHEDFDTYPRTLSSDCQALAGYDCSAVFAPTVREIYPKGLSTEIDIPRLSTILCGHHRPGHFKGVATVVCKLLNIVQPDIAVFGNKDYQQLQIIKTMVEDLLLPVQVIGTDTKERVQRFGNE